MRRITLLLPVLFAACWDARDPLAPPRDAPASPFIALSPPTLVISAPVDLGALATGMGAEAYRVNNLGHAVGWGYLSTGQYHAVLWTAPGKPFDLGTLPGGAQSYALGVNDVNAGCGLLCASSTVEYVVGASEARVFSTVTRPHLETHAFRWDAKNGMIDLGTLGGAWSTATGVNSAGNVVGISYTASGVSHAFAWSPGTGMQDLGTLGAGGESRASDLDAAGAGGASNGHVVRWSSTGVIEDMGLLPGSAPSNIGYGVNALGWVAGAAYTNAGSSAGATHAVLWTGPNQARDLGTLPGGVYSSANAVNDLGWVVGYELGTGRYTGFIWSDTDGMLQLPSFTPTPMVASWANDINGGFVVGAISGSSSVFGTLHPAMWTVTQQQPPPSCVICSL